MVVNIADNEELIVRQACNGDLSAQRTLYKDHVRYLTAVCSRYILNPEDVKDVLQESFIKIFSSLASFEYRGKGSLRGWMSRVLINETLKYMRKTSRLEFAELTEDEYYIPFEDPNMDDLQASEIYSLIRDLPDGYRTIFNLYVIEEKSHKEIAEILNIKESTSASQLHRAKALLASRIRKYQLSLKSAII